MHSIQALVHSHIEIKKSHFYGFVAPFNDESEIQRWFASLRAQFPNANHVCTAYVLNEGQTVRFDDDGEPSRTAGFPIAEVLRKHDLTNVAAAVVREFGGIKLGASGLVRAYTKSVSEALEKAVKVSKQTLLTVTCTLSYPLHARLERFLEERFTVITTEFDAQITLTLQCLKDDYALLLRQLHDKAQAPIDLKIKLSEEVYR